MEQQASFKTAIAALVLFVAGLVGGYVYGQPVGIKEGITLSEAPATKTAEDVMGVEELAAQAANPFAAGMIPSQPMPQLVQAPTPVTEPPPTSALKPESFLSLMFNAVCGARAR